MAAAVPGLLGRFAHVDAAADAIRELKATGHRDLTVYSATPNHELEEAIGDPISPVRLWTLVAGLVGCAAGFSLTIWMSSEWPHLTGGKPITAVPAFVAIAFELTILFGAMATVLGVIILSAMKSLKGRPYHPTFSDDHVGVFVPCGNDQAPAVERLLKQHGSVEVTHAA